MGVDLVFFGGVPNYRSFLTVRHANSLIKAHFVFATSRFCHRSSWFVALFGLPFVVVASGKVIV